MGVVKIDIGAMQAMLDGIPEVCERLSIIEHEIQSTMSHANAIVTRATVPHVRTMELGEAIWWLDTQKTPTRERLDLARHIATSPILMDLNAGTAPTTKMFPKHLVELNDRLAGELHQLIEAALRGNLSDEQWDLLIDALRYASPEEYAAVAARIFRDISPEDLATLVQRLSDDYEKAQRQAGRAGPDHVADILTKLTTDYHARITPLGELLGAATRNDPHWAADYAQRMADAMTTPGSPGAAALSLVLSYGQYDPHFALTITEAIYNYETSRDFPGWGKHSGGKYVLTAGYENQDGHLGGVGQRINDAMAGTLAMLGSSADASQTFFTEGGTEPFNTNGQHIDINTRLKHLLTEHDWQRWVGAPYHSDQGNGLGKAIEAATTAYRDTEDTGHTSAEITTQIIAIIGGRTNQPDDWQIPLGMSDSIAEIVSSYAPDLFYQHVYGPESQDLSQGLSHKDNPYFPGFPIGAVFAKEDMDAILRSLGRNPDDVLIVAEGWAIANATYQARYLQEGFPTPAGQATILHQENPGRFWNNLSLGADVLDNIIKMTYEGNQQLEADEAAKAKLNAAIFGTILSLPVPGLGKAVDAGEAADWAYGQARTQTTNWIKDQVIAAVAEATSIEEINQVTLDAAVAAQIQMMYDQGFWSQETLDIANQGAHPGNFEHPPPPEAFIAGTTQFDTNSGAYRNWLYTQSSLKEFIEDAVKEHYGDYFG